MSPVPVLELAVFALFACALGIRVFWRLDGEWVLRHIARRCDIHDRPSPLIIRQLEADLGIESSGQPLTFTEAYSNPRLIDCGHSWCRIKREKPLPTTGGHGSADLTIHDLPPFPAAMMKPGRPT